MRISVAKGKVLDQEVSAGQEQCPDGTDTDANEES